MLSVPVQHQASEGLAEGADRARSGLTADMLLSSHGNWQHQHWNALVSNYRQSPFFDYYADSLLPLYKPGTCATLREFNLALHAIVMEHLGLLTLPEAIKPRTPEFQVRPYYQVFQERHGFLPDLSIVDLLFNMGPEARLYL